MLGDLSIAAMQPHIRGHHSAIIVHTIVFFLNHMSIMFMHWPDDHGAMLTDSMRQFLIVVKANHPTLTRYRAALSYGNAGADSDNPAIRKQARAMLRELMDCGVKNQYTQYARMNLAIDFFNRGHHQRAFTLMATFHKSDGVFYAMSRYWLKRFDHSYKSRASANSGGR